MNYWIFSVAPHKSDSESYTARQIYERRMQDKFWGLRAAAANRKNVRKGDQVVYYSAKLEQAFVGTARLASDCFELNAEERSELWHGSAFTAEYGVRLDDIDEWPKQHRMAELVSHLKFVKNTVNWGAYLRGSIRQIEESDYAAIASGSPTSADGPFPAIEELAALSRFPLEAHLEEFIAHNWSKIFGEELELYSDGEQTGQQYPAGTWSIDFLARDVKTKELVVIELKRGQASDATIGQVLPYINWIKKNLAKPDQTVRGIIVASEIDDALRYAVMGLSNVSLKTYTVTFSLQTAEI